MSENRIEDAFNAFFTGETLKNALDFAEFIRANEMIYNGAYEIHYKDKLACYIDTPNDKSHMWRVWTVGDYSGEYEGFPIDDRMKEIARANVIKCGNCDDCNRDPGKTETIFGKEFVHVCNGTDNLAMRFENPDAEAVKCAIKMVGMRKYDINGRCHTKDMPSSEA
ncbi:MAG: hypothetical protein FWF47_01855 [Clostridia bacterium]|nr:hypothetical protein [Clostridia bacterium]